MSVIDSDEELDYTVEDIDTICRQEEEINLEDLLAIEIKEKEVFKEKEIDDIIYDINLGQDVIKKFTLASETNTPINFIYIDKDDQYFSLFNKLKGEEEIIEKFNFYNRNYGLGIDNYLLAYFIANIDSKKSFLIEKINSLSRATNLVLEEDNFDEVKERYMARLEALNKKTLEEYEKIKKFYQNLSDMEYSTAPTEIAKSLKLFETKVSMKVSDGEYKFNIDTGAIIFNNMKPNYYFPFIQYQGIDDKYYKFFDKEDLVIEEVLATNERIKKISEEEKDKRENYIFVLARLPLVPKEKYTLLEFNLDKSILFFSYPGNSIEFIKKKLPSLLDDIVLEPEKIENVKGSFQINFPNYDNTRLYFLSLFESTFNKFLYVKEESKPRSLVSERDKYYFKTYNEEKSTRGYKANFFIEPLYGDKYNIIFRTKLGNNSNNINEFALILSKLAWYYNNLKDEDLETQFSLVTEPYTGPDGKGFGAPLSEKKERVVTFKTNKIDNLITTAPEIFPKSEYSRKCGCPKQPIIIPDEDIEFWKEYEFEGKKHNVVTFPPPESDQNSKRYNFVCPTENNILSFIRNPDQLSEYPILPCCSLQKKNELYDKYDEIREDPVAYFTEKEEARGKGVQLKTVKILATNQVGFLPEELQSFLKRVYPNTEFNRLGVLKNSKSSMIHCLLLASEHIYNLESKNVKNNEKIERLTKFRKIFMEKNIVKREQVVNLMRKNIDNFVQVLSASQENYNLNEKQLSLRISNNEEVFDSHYYYKLLENIFYVNIFVFVYEDSKISLERPHHRFFHNREINFKLPSVCLLKHVSSKTFPVYELIQHDGTIKGTDFTFLYTDIFTKYMNNYINKNPYYICESHKDKDYTVRINYYQNINWNYLLADYEIVGQAINDSGRAYRINIKVDDQELSIYIPPSFPLNVPLREKIVCGTKALALDLFEADSMEGCCGMWFDMNGCKKAVFIPCKDMGKNENVNTIYEIERTKKISDDNFYQLNTINRNANIIKQLIVWCWNLSDLEDVEDWFEKYVIETDSREENISFNNMPININYRFPLDIDDTESAIRYISYYIPIIFRNGHIQLYDKLYMAIKQYLLNYKAVTTGLSKVANKAIINAFANEQDFTDYPYTRVIVGETNWQEWVNFVTVPDIASQEIEEEDSKKIRPFVFQNDKGHIYIIQNNIDNKLTIALLISKVWKSIKVNLGYYTNEINIWNCIDKDNRILETVGISKDTIISRANQLSDRKIKTFCDAIQFLDRNEIKYEDKKDCHYLLYKNDGSVIKEGNCKNEFQEIYQYDNGNYASMLRII